MFTPQTILLVEDYLPGMMVSRWMIEHLGYAVESVASGLEAAQKVRDSEQPFMAILMDVNMGGMNGFEATKIIRGIEQETGGARNTIIAVTAHALAGDRLRCLEADMDDYISKPIHPDILAQKLSALAKKLP